MIDIFEDCGSGDQTLVVVVDALDDLVKFMAKIEKRKSIRKWMRRR